MDIGQLDGMPPVNKDTPWTELIFDIIGFGLMVLAILCIIFIVIAVIAVGGI